MAFPLSFMPELRGPDPREEYTDACPTPFQHADSADGASVTQVAPGQVRIRVQREISYDLLRPKKFVFDPEDDTLAGVVSGRPVFLVVDRLVNQLYRREIDHYTQSRLHAIGSVVCAASEANKTLRTVEQICEAAHAAALPRDGIFVAVGGGITLDLAGFAAACFRRGVGYVRVPTTLIGLVDVAVGVKQAANAFGSKNMLGAFYPPIASILDYSFLQTLPRTSLSSGFAEVLKMAVIRDGDLLTAIEQHGRALIDSGYRSPRDAGRRIAERAEFLMAQELAGNLYESCLARLVDFGHTFSPVIETASHYTVAHGEAVAIDILLSTSIAAQRNVCSRHLFDRLVRIVGDLGLPLWPGKMPSSSQLADSLVVARLHRGGSLNLVVPRAGGAATFLQSVSNAEVENAVRDLQRAARMYAPAVSNIPTQEYERHASFGL